MTPAGLCVFCKTGERRRGQASLTLSRDDTVVIVHHIPAEVCDNCGHAYFDGSTVDALEKLHEVAIAAGAKFAVRDYATKVA